MKSFKYRTLILAIALTLGATTPSEAKIVSVGFNGTLTSAVNNVYDDPDIPSGNFFQVGQSFSGTFVYNTGVPVYYENTAAFLDLQSFSVNIGGQDFSSRFLPRQIFRTSDGGVSFSAGGADQGGGTSIDLNLGSFYGSYPTEAELNGKSASFRFDDYYPLGGQVSGDARLTATSAVPEPSAWLLMIIGFGTVGSSLRRQRNAITPGTHWPNSRGLKFMLVVKWAPRSNRRPRQQWKMRRICAPSSQIKAPHQRHLYLK